MTLRQGEQNRLLHEALRSRPKQPPYSTRFLSWLGRRLVVYGSKMLERSAESSPGSPHPALPGIK